MDLTFGEKIKVILDRQSVTYAELAERLGTSRQNLTNKFSRDNFSEKEVREIAEKLSCKFDGIFTLPDGKTL